MSRTNPRSTLRNLNVKGGFAIEGTAMSASASTLTAAVAGTAAGFKVNGGTTSVSASGTVYTGLTTVVGFNAAILGTAAPGTAGPSILTVGTANSGSVAIYGWKATGTADYTLIAATGTATVSWVAFGT